MLFDEQKNPYLAALILMKSGSIFWKSQLPTGNPNPSPSAGIFDAVELWTSRAEIYFWTRKTCGDILSCVIAFMKPVSSRNPQCFSHDIAAAILIHMTKGREISLKGDAAKYEWKGVFTQFVFLGNICKNVWISKKSSKFWFSPWQQRPKILENCQIFERENLHGLSIHDPPLIFNECHYIDFWLIRFWDFSNILAMC